jgi:hypothetical protein
MPSPPHRSGHLRFQQARAKFGSRIRECKGTKLIRRMEGVFQGLLALMTHREVEKLMITHTDGRTQLMDDVLEQVVTSWDVIFARDGL